MSIVNKECDFLYFIFCVSPTKGLAIFENLLLPEQDQGITEKMYVHFTQLKHNGQMDQGLCDRIIKSLQKVRQLVLSNLEERAVLEARIEMIRKIIAVDLIVAEDKLSLGNLKFN
jgi:hypothetical protein